MKEAPSFGVIPSLFSLSSDSFVFLPHLRVPRVSSFLNWRTNMTINADAQPDVRGRFGDFGGRYVPESIMASLDQLEQAYAEAMHDPAFLDELSLLQRTYVGRPTPLYHARNLSAHIGAQVYLKREDLAHTGAHKINNALGQALLTRRMGKKRVIAETGAGQHGVATATACALLG